MASIAPPAAPPLTFDEIDDLLYFTRVNEASDLKQTIAELAQKHQCGAKEILGAAVDPESGNSTLHYCAANGLADLLPTLLSYFELSSAPSSEQTAPPPTSSILNRTNAQGSTPLHWAALNGHLAVVRLLIEGGADMWVKNSAGHLAMFEAERADKGDVVQYLLEAGGKEVEKAGMEGNVNEQDMQEMAEEDAAEGSSSTAGADVKMGEAGPS